MDKKPLDRVAKDGPKAIVHAIFPHIDSAFRIPKNRYGLLLYRIEVQHYQNIFLCLRQPRLKDMRLSQRSL